MNKNYKIYEEIWVATKGDTDDNLSYMCQVTENKAFESRQETGRNWAKHSVGYWDVPPDRSNNWRGQGHTVTHYDGTEAIYLNEPIAGFTLGKSTDRYTTSNKHVRVADPRGFTVELTIPNLAKLIQCTTIINGVIQEELLWARDGRENILVIQEVTNE